MRGPHMMGLDLYEQICEDIARYESISHERATYDGTRLGMSRYVKIQQDMRGFHMRGPHMMGPYLI